MLSTSVLVSEDHSIRMEALLRDCDPKLYTTVLLIKAIGFELSMLLTHCYAIKHPAWPLRQRFLILGIDGLHIACFLPLSHSSTERYFRIGYRECQLWWLTPLIMEQFFPSILSENTPKYEFGKMKIFYIFLFYKIITGLLVR